MSHAVKQALQSLGRTGMLAGVLASGLIGAGYVVLFELLGIPDSGEL
jgi:hypothetical protein